MKILIILMIIAVAASLIDLFVAISLGYDVRDFHTWFFYISMIWIILNLDSIKKKS